MTREQLLAALANADAAGDEEAMRAIAAMIHALPAETAPQAVEAPATTPTSEAEPGSLNEDDLRADPDFVEAARITYERNEGHAPPPEMDATALANYGLDDIGMFNNNLAVGGFQAATLLNATPEQKKAYLYLMDSSEKLGWSWESFGQGVKGIATDPTTYVGISTLGIGTAVAQGGKMLTREGIKQMLKAGIDMGVRGAVEGAVYGAAQEGIRQTVQVQGGGRDGYSLGDIAIGAATGAAVGGVLGGTVGVGENALKTRSANKLIKEAEQVFQPAPAAPPASTGATTPVTPNVPVETTLRAANDTPTPHDPLKVSGPSVTTDAKIPDGTVVANPGPANENLKGLTGPILGAQTHLNSIVDAIKVLAPTENPAAIRQIDGTQKLKLLNAATKGISDMLEHAARLGDGATLTDLLMRTGVTGAQMQVLKNSAQQANDELLREVVRVTKEARGASLLDSKKLRDQVDHLENTRAAVQRLDMDLSTQSGRDLRMRQEGLNAAEVRGLSVKALQEEGGLSRKEAEAALIHTVSQREGLLQNKAALDALNTRIDIATKAQDFTMVQQLRAQKDTILGKVDEQLSPGGVPTGKVARFFRKAVEGVLEVMISNVFSTSTIIINTIPTYLKIISKPMLNYVAKGITEPGAFRGMLASYHALNSMQMGAFKAAGVAFKYERSLLLQDSERAFFGSNVIPKRFGGGIIRFIPRVLNATDEYMAQLAYRSYGVARATTAAVSDAKLKGLAGKDMDTFIEKAVADATERLYTTDPAGDQHVIDLLMDQAMDRGLGGEKANAWVRKQLLDHPEQLKQAENVAGRNYVNDLLFKREFSGDNAASKIAKEYEAFVQKNPIMKIAGQLFFRTPIRVFEEGIRLTPGLNLVAPNYIADLAGKNGTARQVRAQGEAMVGYGLGMSTMALYASGGITGGGPQDFRQRRQGENTADFEPYTITLPNGDKWSYRNLDPIATPLKIIVNALDRLQTLEYRRKQGEIIPESAFHQAVGFIGVGMASVSASVMDANLFSGVSNVASFIQSLNDPRAGNQGDQAIKGFGNFLATAIPSQWTKTRMVLGEGFQNDPITIEQILRAKINPDDPLVPRQYTAVGTPRKLTNPEANVWIFHPSTPAARERGKGDHELAVEEDLWMLAQAADTDFTPPLKHDLAPAIPDLRKKNTKDGKETYYDRWQRYVRESDVVEALYTNVVTSGIPFGTPGNSERASAVNETLNLYREQAMLRLVREELGTLQGVSDEALREMLQRQTTNLNTPF